MAITPDVLVNNSVKKDDSSISSSSVTIVSSRIRSLKRKLSTAMASTPPLAPQWVSSQNSRSQHSPLPNSQMKSQNSNSSSQTCLKSVQSFPSIPSSDTLSPPSTLSSPKKDTGRNSGSGSGRKKTRKKLLLKCPGSSLGVVVAAISRFTPQFFKTKRICVPGQVQNYLQNSEMDKAMALINDPQVKAVNSLKDIWGVGMSTAAKMYNWGVTSPAMLWSDKEVIGCLNASQLIGLTHVEDFKKKIPRAELELILERVKETVDYLGGGKLTCQACGSYRRGKGSSGDIDVLITPKDGTSEEWRAKRRQRGAKRRIERVHLDSLLVIFMTPSLTPLVCRLRKFSAKHVFHPNHRALGPAAGTDGPPCFRHEAVDQAQTQLHGSL